MKMRKSYVLLLSLGLFLIFSLLKISYEAHTDAQKFVEFTKHNVNNEVFRFYKKHYSFKRINEINAHLIENSVRSDYGVFKSDIKELLSKNIMPITLSDKEQLALYDYFHCSLLKAPQEEIYGMNQFSLIKYNKPFEEISEVEKKWLDDFCIICEMRRIDCSYKNLSKPNS